MEPNFYLKKCPPLIYLTALWLLPATNLQAQICQNPMDTIYGLSTTGVIYPINVNNANIGIHLDSLTSNPGIPPLNANGMGFSSLNGKFYYFERSLAITDPDSIFVSYDPATKTVQQLAGIPSGAKIRSGCVNNTGTGYYTIDPSGPTLYYYSIADNSWTAITSSFRNASNVTIPQFNTLTSGDMAFDGQGNLWVLTSSTSNYALYRIAAPVPTTPVASLTATQIIGQTSVPTPGKGITGLAFNATGTAYLSTGTGDNKLYRLATATSALSYVATFPKDDVGSDLTSCSFPMSVLTSVWLDFKAKASTNIELTWTAMEHAGTAGYIVEYSTNRTHWKTLAYMQKQNAVTGTTATYNYVHRENAATGRYYRIVQTTTYGKQHTSTIQFVNTHGSPAVHIGPNPVNDVLNIFNNGTARSYRAQVFDNTGRLLYSTTIAKTQHSINVEHLSKGTYLLKLVSSLNEATINYSFIKW